MGQITDNIIAYREGKITLDALCNFLATFDYQPSGIPAGFVGWQLMYASPSALENTIQEMISTAETLLTTDEYRAVLTAYKAHPLSRSTPTMNLVTWAVPMVGSPQPGEGSTIQNGLRWYQATVRSVAKSARR
jgi:hypothetical protein